MFAALSEDVQVAPMFRQMELRDRLKVCVQAIFYFTYVDKFDDRNVHHLLWDIIIKCDNSNSYNNSKCHGSMHQMPTIRNIIIVNHVLLMDARWIHMPIYRIWTMTAVVAATTMMSIYHVAQQQRVQQDKDNTNDPCQ